MLLKNKAPSLKTQINIETTSTNGSNSYEVKSDPNVLNFVQEEFCEIPNLNIENLKIVNDATLDCDSKYNLVEMNEINSLSMKSGIDVIKANLSSSNDTLANYKNISLIDLNNEVLLPSPSISKKRTLKKLKKNSVASNSTDKTSNRKRKSESFDEFESSDQESKNTASKKSKKIENKIGKTPMKPNIIKPKSLNTGVYVECDICHKTRYLQDVLDPSEIPSFWTCEMEKHKTLNCEMLQENFDESVDYFINNSYTLGSIVWARAPGFCWWPGIIDEDPDLHLFYWCYEDSNDVSHYHVTFLDDDVSRSWVTNRDIKVFRGKSDMSTMKFVKSKKDYTKNICKAVEKAEECLKLSLQECLDKYSFAVRYNGKPNIWTAKKFPKKRKLTSKNCLENIDTDDSLSKQLDCEEKACSSKNNPLTKTGNIKIECKLNEINMEASKLEAESEKLLRSNQQTKHDLIMRNSVKESKNKKVCKTRKKIKKTG